MLYRRVMSVLVLTGTIAANLSMPTAAQESPEEALRLDYQACLLSATKQADTGKALPRQVAAIILPACREAYIVWSRAAVEEAPRQDRAWVSNRMNRLFVKLDQAESVVIAHRRNEVPRLAPARRSVR
jgi:hypothetical protein